MKNNPKEALYWEKREGTEVQCRLCPHGCRIKEGKTGFCRVRRNRGGRLYATTYGRVAAAGLDPIEKKPLYHFHPGSMILSLGQAGCTFHCDFCQNYHMLSADIPLQDLPPGEAVQLAAEKGSFAIAYTYNEPWVGYEYVFETSETAREAGLKNVLVTNGYYMEEPFEDLAPYVDAMNIDLKSIREDFYATYTSGELEPVRRTTERALELGIHVELTNLLITGLNDSEEDVGGLVDYVAGLGRDIPLHLSRYRPAYRMDRPPTPPDVMLRAYQTASDSLDFVYLGNMAGGEGTDTVCPRCGTLLVSRRGFSAQLHALEESACSACGKEVNLRM